MSCGTTSLAGMLRACPSRTTTAQGAESSPSFSRVRSVRYSWKKPSRALIKTIATMVSASVYSPISAETTVAASRIMIMASRNCPAKILSIPAFLPARMRFSPCSASSFSACRPVSP